MKRQKVTVACKPCRNRKVKCDGRVPVCEPCEKRAGSSTPCTWDTRSSRLGPQELTHQVDWLDSRIRRLEGSKTHPHTNGASDSFVSPNGHNPKPTEAPRLLDASRSWSVDPIAQASANPHPGELNFSRQESTSSRVARAATSPLQSQKTSGTSGDLYSPEARSVHAIIGATADEDCTEGFYGSSSAGNFMQNVRELVEQRLSGDQSSNEPLLGGGHGFPPLTTPGNVSQQKQLDYVLPSRKKADKLMETYWKYVQTLYPYLDRLQVQDDYEKIWEGTRTVSDERSLMRLLNSMFALASQIDTSLPPEERESAASVFYHRAQELLVVVEPASVRSVQSYLILGQYFQSTIEPHHCWVFVGLAIRTAQSLGLHLPETSAHASHVPSRELIRKVWHGCILMDRILSMIYGRPSMIGSQSAMAVPLPLAMDEEILSGGAPQKSLQPQQPSVLSFYTFSLKLYEILHDVLFNFYFHSMQDIQTTDRRYDEYFGDSPTGHPSVFELERRLSRWEQSVPDHLRIGNYGRNTKADDTVFYRQAVVLHQRQLNVRLLLLKPVLSHFVTLEFRDGTRSDSFGSPLSQRIFFQCAIVCVMTAQEAIDTIYNKKCSPAGESGLLAAWWYNVLYLYTAATVLIAARMSLSILAEISEESILDRWNKALEVLEEYGVFGTSIRRLSTTLHLLFDAVPQQYSRLRQQPRPPVGDLVQEANANPQAKMASSSWRMMDSTGSLPSTLYDQARDIIHDDSDSLLNDPLPNFVTAFDPNDLSWLTTTPFNI